MKYDHMVKVNGAYYKAGEEVPEEIKMEEAPEEIKMEEAPEEAEGNREQKATGRGKLKKE